MADNRTNDAPDTSTNRDYVTSAAAMTSTHTVVAAGAGQPGISRRCGEAAPEVSGSSASASERRYDFEKDVTLFRAVMARVTFDPDGCWLWQGACSGSGYPRISIDHRLYMVHRVLFLLAFGEVDGALDIDRLCRVRACVNPAHLDAVSKSENVIRAVPYRRPMRPPVECRNGHRYTELDQRPDGHWRCHICLEKNRIDYCEARRKKRREARAQGSAR